MCKGDDPACAEFEAHRLQFHDDMPEERGAFLVSNFVVGDFPS